MPKVYVGANDIAHQIKKIYVGDSNGVAREVKKVYVGINGVAKRIYPERVYLWNNATGDNYELTGGWSAEFAHQTNSGNDYTRRTRMNTSNVGQYGWLIENTYSCSDSSTECAMYARTVKAIYLTPYKKLCASMYRNYAKANDADSAYFGVFNSSSSGKVTCKSSELTTKFLAYKKHNTSKGIESFTLEIDISNITGSYIIAYDNYSPNMNNTININFSNIWLE